MDNIEVFYEYGFFVPKNTDIYDTSNMKYKKRLNFELSKVRVDVNIKIGKLYFINRIKEVPKAIETIVNEITKVKMIVECEYSKNEKVLKSIPKVDSSIIRFRIVRDENFELDIDEILDKISNQGIESLTKEEKEFLDNSSKQ